MTVYSMLVTVFIYNAGYGQLEISELDYSGMTNVLRMGGSGITAASLTVTIDRASNLYLADGVGGDQIQIDNRADPNLTMAFNPCGSPMDRA